MENNDTEEKMDGSYQGSKNFALEDASGPF